MIDHYFHSCSYLNDNVYVHLNSQDRAYVTLVLLGVEYDAISWLLGDQFLMSRYLHMSGLHNIWPNVSKI